MPFVLDASVAACWCFPDEHSIGADIAMECLLDDAAITPALWPYEIRNILVVNERRHRIEPADGDAFLRELARLPIRVRHDTDEKALTALARKHRLTVYDAAYLDLAIRAGVAVATLDRALAQAVSAEGLQLVCG